MVLNGAFGRISVDIWLSGSLNSWAGLCKNTHLRTCVKPGKIRTPVVGKLEYQKLKIEKKLKRIFRLVSYAKSSDT